MFYHSFVACDNKRRVKFLEVWKSGNVSVKADKLQSDVFVLTDQCCSCLHFYSGTAWTSEQEKCNLEMQ